MAAQRRSDGSISVTNKSDGRKYSELIKEETTEAQASVDISEGGEYGFLLLVSISIVNCFLFGCFD